MQEITANEREELAILQRANEKGKFAIPVISNVLSNEADSALERLQLREWIRLIDVTFISPSPMPQLPPHAVYRVFMLTPQALAWMRRFSN